MSGTSGDLHARPGVASGEAGRREARGILCVGGALGLLAAGYLLFLRHRTDYAGHLLAGYGATLGALGLLAWLSPPAFRARHGRTANLVGTLLCVGGGLVLEASVFRIAHFDPMDAWNQSLGAVAAGLSVRLVALPEGPPPATVAVGALLSAAAVAAGFLLAFR